MAREVRLWVGTRKGVFEFCSDDGRQTWQPHQPKLLGWSVNHVIEDPREPSRVYAAANHMVWGPWMAVSTDGGETWNERASSPAFPAEEGTSVSALWSIAPGHAERPGVVWAGVDPGALFRSDDWGATWTPVDGLNKHETRDLWQAGGGGLCLHSILPHPDKPESLMVTISAGGTFRSDDDGETWIPLNKGIAADFMPDPNQPAGHCVHKLVRSAGDPDYLFQQNHCGPYRSEDGGLNWTATFDGLPSTFGFAAAAHPHQPRTFYVSPLDSDMFRSADGALAIWRTRDGGNSWEPLRCGLPQQGAYLSMYRAAMTTDREDDPGIYAGTSTGQIFASRDGGEHWEMIADYLPPILSLETSVV